MLLSLAQWLQSVSPEFGSFRVFQYLTFRAVMAALTALLIGLIAGPFVIRRLISLKIGQPIREYAMQTHLSKSGTPTMGGVLILLSIGISTLLWADLSNRFVWIVMVVTLGFGAIGWVDDWRKVVLKDPEGMRSREKYFWQSVVGLVAALYLVFSISESSNLRVLELFLSWVQSGFDSLNTSTLFGDAARSDSFRVGNAFGQAVVVPFGGPRATPRPGPTESSDIIAARRMERLQRLVRERNPDLPGAAGDVRPGLEALCRGAGIEPAALPAEAAAPMLQLAGRLLREAIVGLKDLDLKHNEQGQAFGLPPRRAATEDPPFKLSTPADDLLVQILASHDSRRLDAGQWLRQNFDQAKRHDDGLAAGALAACEAQPCPSARS